MKWVREWLLYKGTLRILYKNNRLPTTICVKNAAVEKLVERLKKKSFYCDVESITPNFKKVHIVSLLN